MATYQKRGKTWQYSISRTKQGLPRLTKGGFSTKSDAQAEAMDIESKLKKGFIVDPIKQEISEYFKDWMELYKKNAIDEMTYKGYEQTLKYLKTYMPNVLISEITASSYQRVLNKFAETHAKASTKGFHTRVRASIQPLIEEGRLQKDFTTRAVVKGNGNDKAEQDKFVNFDEYKKLVDYFRNRLNPNYSSPTMLFIISITGMRASEAFGLVWDDIDFDNNVIKCHRTWNYRNKIGGFKKPKTDAGIRDIVIDDESMQLLKDFREQQKTLFESLGIKPIHDFVCYHPYRKIITLSALQNTLDHALKKLKISTPLTVHGLRHTHASVLLYHGVDIMTVSKRLGHASVAITQQTYIHIIKELENKDKDKIIELLLEL